MNLLKVLAIAFFLAIAAALVVLRASAQQPTSLPHVNTAIPVTPPPGWDAKQWANLRTRCQEIADKAAAHRPFARGDWSTAGVCGSLGVEPPPPPNGDP